MQSDQLRPGSNINTHFLNRLSNQANRGAIQVAGQGISAQDTPGGMVVSLQPDAEFQENCMRMVYIGSTGLVLPAYTIVHIAINEGTTTAGINYWPLPSCDIVDVTGRIRLGILQEDAQPGCCPMVQYQGISQCYWNATSTSISGQNNYNGQRLGSYYNSPFPIWDCNGPLMILNNTVPPASFQEYFSNWDALTNTMQVPAYPAVYLATVAIVGVRDSDSLLCYQAGEIQAPYNCFNFSSNFQVVDGDVPGDVYVTEMG